MTAPEERAIRVRLTLRPLSGFGGPPLVRLRRLLKCMKRSFGWIAVTAEELPPHGDAPLNAPEPLRTADPGDGWHAQPYHRLNTSYTNFP
jgi:hypothetical protein